jgi:hypothetical protein
MINRIKDKNQTIISKEAEKNFDKIQHLMKVLKKIGTKGTYVNIINPVYYKPMTNIVLNGKKIKPVSLKSNL